MLQSALRGHRRARPSRAGRPGQPRRATYLIRRALKNEKDPSNEGSNGATCSIFKNNFPDAQPTRCGRAEETIAEGNAEDSDDVALEIHVSKPHCFSLLSRVRPALDPKTSQNQ